MVSILRPAVLPGRSGSLSAYYRVERSASIWEPAKGCLVLLLSGVSGSGTMNDSPCVSTLTTTRRRPSRPKSPTRLLRVSREVFGNASSIHHFGQQAKATMDEARSAVAALLNADPSEIVFTSGGTEVGQLRDPRRRRGARADRPPSSDRERHRTRGGAQHAARARPPRLADDAAAGRSHRHRLARSAARGDRRATPRSSR